MLQGETRGKGGNLGRGRERERELRIVECGDGMLDMSDV